MRELARQLHELKGLKIHMESGPCEAPGIGRGTASAISLFPKKRSGKPVKDAIVSIVRAKELLEEKFPAGSDVRPILREGKHTFLGLLFSDIEPSEHDLRAQTLLKELEKLGHKHNVLK